jgi:3-hydroxyisobutyrate dehydrogenase-like beta-hydroxyacid dehydrogenase
MGHLAFLGTGLMGSGMVERFRSLDVAVTAWNRTRQKALPLEALGARVEDTAVDAARGAERIHLILSDDAAVDEVLGGLLETIAPEQVIVDHSTTSPAGTRARAERLAAKGIPFLHAPVFMSPAACRAGMGVMLAAGPSELVERLRPALSRMTGELWHVGTAMDRAAAFKLFGNAMIFAMCAGLSDVFAMGKALGISSPEVQELFSHFNVGAVLAYRGSAMAQRNFQAAFELTMARKDLGLMLDSTKPHEDLLLVLPIIARRFDELIRAGHGSADLGVIAVDTATVREA